MRVSIPPYIYGYLRSCYSPGISWSDNICLSPRGRQLPKDCPKVTSQHANIVYNAWLASRNSPTEKGYLAPGTQRPLNRSNVRLAVKITNECVHDLFRITWGLHPLRAALMLSLNIIRSIFPAFRGYSQAILLDELQSLILSHQFTWLRIVHLLLLEVFRRVVEGALESLAVANETVVLNSARFYVERQQLEQRVRLDMPTLADPVIRDLLQESDLFTRSFQGMGGFGLLSPLDFMHILTLFTEIASHLLVIFSLTRCTTHVCVLIFSTFSAALPLIIAWLGPSQRQSDPWSYTIQEAHAADRQEKMRSLVYNETYRPEVVVFDLGPWILDTWSTARKFLLNSERAEFSPNAITSLHSHIDVSDLLSALQNIPLILILQTSSASLGSLTLYRSSIQSVVFAVKNLLSIARMAFQGIFLMGAFFAAMKIKPRLEPENKDAVSYRPVARGMSIEARGLYYTYPGNSEPTLRDVNFSLEPGETLAIVGHNGSGKSTLVNVLLRITDFDRGDLLINGVDIRRYNPGEYHQHVTAVFQGFSKYNSSVQENVGLGSVEHMESVHAIRDAIRLADADGVVDSLPNGLQTMLEASVYDSINYGGYSQSTRHHGLSGGEWQRIANARAFMRARQPCVDLLLLDEPTSSLDAHAQNHIFNTIADISKDSSGSKCKTVIFITHRLSTARRADKIAMMEQGTITEFGTHDELLRKDGAYAALYKASI